jgi:hypothetical protein
MMRAISKKSFFNKVEIQEGRIVLAQIKLFSRDNKQLQEEGGSPLAVGGNLSASLKKLKRH